jgi:hypothetical protein
MAPFKRPFIREDSQSEPEPPRKKQLRKHTCLVCDVEKGINQYPSPKKVSFHQHGSNICRHCFLRHLETELDSKNWDQVACPECPVVLTYREVKSLTDPVRFAKYEQASLRSALASDGDYRHCLSTECDAGQVHVGGSDEPIFRCQACGHKHCVACESLWHENETCEQYQQRHQEEQRLRQEQEQLNEQSRAVVDQISKPCPRCKVPIEKNNGCDHMTCGGFSRIEYLIMILTIPTGTRCRHQFCWRCFADYREIYSHGNQQHKESCRWYRPIEEPEPEAELREQERATLGWLGIGTQARLDAQRRRERRARLARIQR